MYELITAALTPVSLLCMSAFFTIIFVVILKVLREMSLFSNKMTVIVSLCVSLLCILGLYEFFISSQKTENIPESVAIEIPNRALEKDIKPKLFIILLPYATLGIAILLSLLLFAAMSYFDKVQRGFPWRTKEKHTKTKSSLKTDDERRMSQ